MCIFKGALNQKCDFINLWLQRFKVYSWFFLDYIFCFTIIVQFIQLHTYQFYSFTFVEILIIITGIFSIDFTLEYQTRNVEIKACLDT